MTSKCEVCLKPIKNRRAGSKYCSATCAGRAKRKRLAEKEKHEINGFNPDYQKNEENHKKQKDMDKTALDELRTIEKDNFNTILNLRTEYGDKIRNLENENLKKDFTIERLREKLSDLNEKHSKDIAAANTSTTKETVQAISQMPAIQTVLGTLASNIIPSSKNGLNGLDEYSEQEKQIINAIRRMQPDAQGYLCQMLYVLFAKPHEEQMEIFNGLRAYMSQPNEDDDI